MSVLPNKSGQLLYNLRVTNVGWIFVGEYRGIFQRHPFSLWKSLGGGLSKQRFLRPLLKIPAFINYIIISTAGFFPFKEQKLKIKSIFSIQRLKIPMQSTQRALKIWPIFIVRKSALLLASLSFPFSCSFHLPATLMKPTTKWREFKFLTDGITITILGLLCKKCISALSWWMLVA